MIYLIAALWGYIAAATYMQIPAEDPATIEARKEYGRAK